MVRINHRGPRDVRITTGRYTNGRLAVDLIESGERYATVSVNVPEASIDDDEFFVKSYSENEGLLEELLRVGLIEFTGRFAEAGGLGTLPVCRLGPRHSSVPSATRYRVTYVDCVLRVAFVAADSHESAIEAATAQTEEARHHHALDAWTDDWQAEPAQSLSDRSCFECGESFAA